MRGGAKVGDRRFLVCLAQLNPFGCSKSSTAGCGLWVPLNGTELEGPRAVTLPPTHLQGATERPGVKTQVSNVSPLPAQGVIWAARPSPLPTCFSPASFPLPSGSRGSHPLVAHHDRAHSPSPRRSACLAAAKNTHEAQGTHNAGLNTQILLAVCRAVPWLPCDREFRF